MKVLIHTDGGSRGNPGPAAIGAVIEVPKGVKEYAQRIEDTTNNEAEYQAVIFALEKTKHLIGKANAAKAELAVVSDSELIVGQLSSRFKVADERMQALFMRVHNLTLDFKKITYTAVPREKNRDADRLVNKALDAGLFA